MNMNSVARVLAKYVQHWVALTASLVFAAGALAQNALITNIGFSPILIAPGDSAVMTIYVANDNPAPVTGLNINSALPAGLQILGYGTNTCGGSVSGVPSGPYGLTGGTVPAINAGQAGLCEVQYVVTSYTSNTAYNEQLLSTEVTGTVGGNAVSGVADVANTLTTTGMSPMTGSKVFTPSTVGAGGVTTLSITINNPNNFIMGGVSFTDAFPAGFVVVASPAPTLSAGCGASAALTAIAGSDTVTLGNADLPANASCQVNVTVQAPASTGTFTNTIPAGGVTSQQRGVAASNVNAITRSLQVQNQLQVSKAFSGNANYESQAPVRLTITVTNPTGDPVTALAINDLLPRSTAGGNPAAIVLAANPDVIFSNSCGFTNITALTAGAESVVVSGGSVGAHSSCSIVVWVRANAVNGGSETVINVIPPGEETGQGSVTGLGGVTGTTPVSAGNEARANINVFNPVGGGVYSITTRKYLTTNANPANNLYPTSLISPRPVDYADNNPAVGPTPVSWIRIDVTNTLTTSPLRNVRLVDQLDRPGFPNASGRSLRADPATILANVVVYQYPYNALDPVGLCQNFVPTAGPSMASNIVDLEFPGSEIGMATASVPEVRCMVQFPVYLDGSALPSEVLGSYADNLPASAVNARTDFATGDPMAPFVVAVNSQPTNTVRLDVVGSVTISKSFSPAIVGPGGVSRLLINLLNYGNVPSTGLTGVAFTDPLPAGLSVSGTGNVSYSVDCAAGGSNLSVSGQNLNFSGLSIPPASGNPVVPGQCSIGIDVVAGASPTTYSNTIPATSLSSIEGITNPSASNTATLTVTNLNITVNKLFDRATVRAGESARMTITLANPQTGAGSGLTNVSFSDDLPNGMILAPSPNIAVTCSAGSNGTPAMVSIHTSNPELTGSGFTLAPGGMCALSLDVQMNGSVPAINTIPANAVTSTQGATNAAPVSATLAPMPSTSIQKSILPATVAVGQPATVTIRVSNSTSGTVGPFDVLDEVNPAAGYPTGVVPVSGYVAPPAATWQIVPGSVQLAASQPAGCVLGGNTTTAGTANDRTQLTGIMVPANSHCDVNFEIVASAVGLYRNAVPQANVSGGALACFNNEDPCFTSADLTVQAAGALQVNKTIAGVTAPDVALAGWIFTVSAANGCDTSNLVLQRTTTATGTVNFASLPVFAADNVTQCTYSVAESGGSSNYTLDPASVLTGLTVSTNSTTTVTANNIRSFASLTITKRLMGAAAGVQQVSGAFVFDVNCGVDGSFNGAIANVADGQDASVTVSDIPSGAICIVTEVGAPAAPEGYQWGMPMYSMSPVVIPANGSASLLVTNPLVGSGLILPVPTMSYGILLLLAGMLGLMGYVVMSRRYRS